MPTGAGKSAGRVSVRVVPDSTGFRPTLQADLDKIERGLQVQVKAVLDDDQLRAQVARLQQTRIELQADVDTARVRQQISSASRSGGEVRLPVQLDGLRVVKFELIRLATNRVVDLVVRVNKASLLAAGSALASLSGGKSAVGYLTQIGSALGGLDKSLPRIALVATSVASIGAAGLASVSGTLSLASSLVAVGGAGIALPGILAGAGLAMGTLTVALSTAKTELAGLVPTLTSFQKAIGGAFFAKAKGPITDLVRTVTGDLRPAFEGLSGSLGSFAAQLATSLQNSATNGVLATVIDRTTTAIDNARAAIAPLVIAFSTLVGIGSSYLPGLATGFADLAGRFNNFVSAAAGDGSLKGWIDTGLAGLQSLGSVVGSVAGILKGLFDAANAATGGNGLAVFAGALQQVSDAVNSSGLQSALTTIFTGAQAGASGLASAIKPIGSLLGELAPTISGVFSTAGSVIGSALSAIATALQSPAFATGLTAFFDGIAAGVAAVLPVLPQIVGALSSVAGTAGLVAAQLGPVFAASFAAVAPVVTSVLTALQPLIPVLGGALINSVSILSVALQALAPVFAAILTAVAPLIPVLAAGLAGAITALAPSITTLVQALGVGLGPAIGAIVSTVSVLAPVLAQVITSLAPLVPMILSLIPPLLQIVTSILPLIPQATAQLVPLIAQLVPLIAQVLAFLMPLIPPLLQLVTIMQVQMYQAISQAAQILSTLVSALQATSAIIIGFVNVAVAAFSGNFSAIPGIISGVMGQISGFVRSALSQSLAFINSFTGGALSKFLAFGSGLVSTISSAFSAFTARISSGISTAVSTIASLPGKAKSALGNLGSLLSSAGADMVLGLISGMRSMIGSLVSAAVDMGKAALNGIKGALGINSPSTVFRDQVGVQIAAGVITGVGSQQARVDAAVAGMVAVPNVARLAAARAAVPTSPVGAAAGGAPSFTFGDVTNVSLTAIVDEIMRRLEQAQTLDASTTWG